MPPMEAKAKTAQTAKISLMMQAIVKPKLYLWIEVHIGGIYRAAISN